MILPWIRVVRVQGAVYTRPSRGQLLDTLDEDYIRAARAKGLSGRRVVFKYGVPAVLTPAVSQLGVADIMVDLVHALLDPRVRIA